jgi:hypothetical protein
MDILTLIIAIIGAVTGIVGTVLSVITTIRDISKDKVIIKVVPANVQVFGPAGEPGERIGIEVLNLSGFPVTVSEVGFKMRNPEVRGVLGMPFTSTGDKLPIRLEPRQSVLFYSSTDFDKKGEFAEVLSAYAKTQCGETAYGNSPALKQIVERARNAAANKV